MSNIVFIIMYTTLIILLLISSFVIKELFFNIFSISFIILFITRIYGIVKDMKCKREVK